MTDYLASARIVERLAQAIDPGRDGGNPRTAAAEREALHVAASLLRCHAQPAPTALTLTKDEARVVLGVLRMGLPIVQLTAAERGHLCSAVEKLEDA